MSAVVEAWQAYVELWALVLAPIPDGPALAAASFSCWIAYRWRMRRWARRELDRRQAQR